MSAAQERAQVFAACEAKLNDPQTSPEEKREIEELLQAYATVVELNPLEEFEPNPKQARFLESDEKIKAFLGGNRSGKTWAGIVDDLIQCIDEQAVPEHLRPYKRHAPPFRCRVVCPDFKRSWKAIEEPLRLLAPKNQLRGGSFDEAFAKQDYVLNFSNGSFIEFMTSEQDRDKFGGTARDRVHYDEEPPKDIRTECRMRLGSSGGDEIFTMTPLMGMTWMYDDIYERRHEPGFFIVEVDTDDNRQHLDWKTLEAAFADMTEEERDARRHGKFVHFGGLVLFMFDDAKHLVAPIDKDHLRGQDTYVGIDPGIRRGAVVWAAIDRDDHMLVFDELYPQNQTISQTASEIKQKNKQWEIDDPVYIIDPSGRNRTLTGEEGPEDEFRRHGIVCFHGENSRRTGIFQLRRRLTHDALKVTSNCTNWLWERGRWRVAADEESEQDRKPKTDKTGDTFATIGPDHLMDCTRYIAMRRGWVSSSEPRSFPTAAAAYSDRVGGPPRRREVIAPTGALT